MLKIGAGQMEALRHQSLHRFETAMVAQLREFSPPLHATLGDDGMRTAVQANVAAAEGYGFTQRGPVQLYLQLTLLLGSRFATDPQYPWATEILGAGELPPPPEPALMRAARLYLHICDYREHVAGPQDAFTLASLRRLQELAKQPPDYGRFDPVDDSMRCAQRLFPEKVEYIGEAALYALVCKAVGGAGRQGFPPARGTMLIAALMLLFGHGCGADPLYPWIGRTLRHGPALAPERRFELLEHETGAWLDDMVRRFDAPAAEPTP